MRPILFYTVGYPGAGKSTVARSLATALQGEHLRGDKIGLELFRFPTYSAEERRMVYAEMNRRTAAHLKNGRHAFYDAANNTVAQRNGLVALAHANGGTAIGVWVETPLEVAKRRAGTARDSGITGSVIRVVPPHIFAQYVQAFEAPNETEDVIRVSGNADFYLQFRRVQRQLRRYDIRLPSFIQL